MAEEYEDDGQTAEVEEKVVGEKSDAEFSAEVKDREKEVSKYLNSGKPLDALPIALNSPPTHAKQVEIKDQNATIVLNVLTAVKEKDIEAAVNTLNADQLDVLMKYIYRGLATGEQSAALLKWHESTLKKAGLGSVVRALTERKTV